MSTVTTPTETVLPHIIHSFIRKYPRAVVHVNDAPPALDLSGLRERKFDLILGRFATPIAQNRQLVDCDVEVLFYDQLVIAAGIRNPWTCRRKIDLVDLVYEPWVMAEANSWNDKSLADAFNARGQQAPKASLIALSATLGDYLLVNGPHIRALPWSSLQRPEGTWRRRY